MLEADRPIVKSEQDRLDRAVFAKYLARCILDHEDSQSLVVGLYGGYGSGKTSIINLMLEEFSLAGAYIEDNQKPIILNFSPWSYSGQNQLIYSFFRRLSSTLRQATGLQNADKIIHLLELYISFFTHKPVPKTLRPKQSLIKNWLNREDAYGWESGRDLTVVKSELNELLRKENRKIIIIIDNISRILDVEIKQIFQIVKSMGDYANTVYVLALDKEQVINAVDRIDGGGGAELLEKIVQLPFEVPAIPRQDIESILLDKLKLVMTYVDLEAWSSSEWAEIFYSSLRFFFDDCRDIARYVNALSFSYPRVKDVVNPVDFFALTVLEIFLPQVYAGVRENKDLFSDLADGLYEMNAEHLQRERLRCDEIIKREARFQYGVVLKLLIGLFPRLKKVYYPTTSIYYSAIDARKRCRISSADVFESYFRLSLQSRYITAEEMQVILRLAVDQQMFSQALARLNQDGRIPKFLDLLDTTAIANIPEQHIGNIINALLDDGDLFPEEEASPLRFNNYMRIHKIISKLLQHIEKTDERFAIMRHAILHATKSLYVIIHEIRQLEQEHIEGKYFLPLEYRLITSEQLSVLKTLAVERILFWIKMNRLIEHPKLLSILYAWKEWGNDDECGQYIQKTTLEDKGLLAFLIAAFHDPIEQAIKKQQRTVSWEKSLENVSAFIQPKWIEAHAKEMFEDVAFERLRENEQLALMMFMDAMQTETQKQIPKTL
ncbi:MAG TPA: P-loop NTPase fold protein [Gammaproteobacteria bacterium]|nr:P-loop NTPase fold protein [Gammaproteobacteria bacterium]